MESYQCDDGDSILPNNNCNEDVENHKRNWGYVVLGTMLGFSGVAAVISGRYMSPSFSASSVGKKLLLAKSGEIMYTSLSDIEKSALFDEFKEAFGREYKSDDEEEEKYQNFKDFLKLVDERNDSEQEAGGSAVHGVTKFADMTSAEFETIFLGYKASSTGSRKLSSGKKADVPTYSGEATVVNWAGVYTTGVRDQGYCGSCWAFSTAEQLESDGIRQGLLTTSQKLSAQQIVSCDVTNYGCNGGNTETAYQYIQKAGGIELESSYPYTSYYDTTGTCSVDGSKFLVTVDEYFSLSGESEMESHMLSTGPISVCLAASTWSSYTSGIVSSCDKNVDHCVQVVGIDTESSYWIVRNSWGTDWGEDGYIYLKSGANTCDITYDPTYVTVTKASLDSK